MNGLKNVELRNLFIDIAIALLAVNLLDISHFVEQSLPFGIYFIVPVQSLGFYLMYADRGLNNIDQGRDLYEKTKNFFSILARASAMFYWILGVGWIFLVFRFLETRGVALSVWAKTISVAVGVTVGILVLVRMFASSENFGGESAEQSYLRSMREVPFEKKRRGEIIILPVYETLVYGKTGENVRAWTGWLVTCVFLIYTETLYEIMFFSERVSKPPLVASMIFSYFPARLVLLTRPPYSLPEAFSAVASFLVFIFMLFYYGS